MRAHMRIDGIAQFIAAPILIEITCRDLRGGMHACVCAPCPFDDDGRAINGGERIFNDLLHRQTIGLALPAAKG